MDAQRVARVAIAGYGFSGRRIHAPLIRATAGMTVTAVVTRSAAGRAAAIADHPSARVLSSVAELRDVTPAPDIVVVATPDASHAELAGLALSSGFSAVVDKPLACGSAPAAELLRLAENGSLLLVPFQNRRWDGDFRTLRRLLASGRLGTVTRFEGWITRWSPGVGTSWRDQPAPAGIDGALGGLGSHLIDQAIALFGPARTVYAEVDTRRPQSRVNDDVFIALTHDHGVRSHLHMGSVTTPRSPAFRLQGTAAGYLKYGVDGELQALGAGISPDDDRLAVEPATAWGELAETAGTTTVPTERSDWAGFYAELRAAVLAGGRVPVDPREVIHGLRVLEAALESTRAGSVVRLAGFEGAQALRPGTR
jgi:scyllo-inositol 2-dehydrogenase (NADP+)